MTDVRDSYSEVKVKCLVCGGRITKDNACYCDSCRAEATKRDNAILDNMNYEQAEKIAVEILKQAIIDYKHYNKILERGTTQSAETMTRNNIKDVRKYISNGLHKHLLHSNPEYVLDLIEREVKRG